MDLARSLFPQTTMAEEDHPCVSRFGAADFETSLLLVFSYYCTITGRASRASLRLAIGRREEKAVPHRRLPRKIGETVPLKKPNKKQATVKKCFRHDACLHTTSSLLPCTRDKS